MLSQKTKYTIRALQFLADKYGQGNIQIKEIAKNQNIPNKFLTVILSELVREGIVISQRGHDGGYQLAISPKDISYGDILRVTRGSLALTPCSSKFNHEPCKNCVDEELCRLKKVMIKVRNETAKLLDNINLESAKDFDSEIGDFFE